LPAPLKPSDIQNKIKFVIQQIQMSDLENDESKRRFLEQLPPWIFGSVGANTSCVSIYFPEYPNVLFVFDAGSGIRELGLTIKVPHYHLFLSHLHWDHIMGFPFFGPAYNPNVTIDMYSFNKDFASVLSMQMKPPYFPTRMETMGSQQRFHILTEVIKFGRVTVDYRYINHPNGACSYRIDDGKHCCLYITDIEITAAAFVRDGESEAFYQNIDLAIIDSQYTPLEMFSKATWGHSSFNLAVDFAAYWSIKHIVLFHHDPTYDDQKIFNIVQAARRYQELLERKDITIQLAIEGTSIDL
jgi:phosphoribosyl 1,2-cyclic phosphodiesterase